MSVLDHLVAQLAVGYCPQRGADSEWNQLRYPHPTHALAHVLNEHIQQPSVEPRQRWCGKTGERTCGRQTLALANILDESIYQRGALGAIKDNQDHGHAPFLRGKIHALVMCRG